MVTMSGKSTANGSSPTISRAHQTAWPRPSGASARASCPPPRRSPRRCDSGRQADPPARRRRGARGGNRTFHFRDRTKQGVIEDYFDSSYQLEDTVKRRGKAVEYAALMADLPAPGATSFTRQQRPATGKTALRIGFFIDDRS
jgi:hypothetical protein